MKNPIRLLLLLLTFAGVLNGCSQPADGSLPFDVVGSQLPGVDALPDGGVLMSWVEPDGEGHRLRYATYFDGVWDEPGTVSRGDNWFVNWADFPSIRVIDEKFWVAHWLVRHGWSAYAYDIQVSITEDAGQTWSQPIRPHADQTPTEHGFVSIYPLEDEAGLVWLDGRETLGNTMGDEILGMSLQSAILTREGEITEALVDPLVCDCCQTDVAISSDAPLLVYRDRDQQEVRDIRLARHGESGWVTGERVAEDDWQVYGCPVNGPAIDAAGHHVGVAWYTQGGGDPRVQFAQSTDGGRTFQDAVVVDDENPLGRVDVVADRTGCSLVSWIGGGSGDEAPLRYRMINSDGQLSETATAAWVSTARPSGFPRMVNTPAGVLIAWTAVDDAGTHVRTGMLEFNCASQPG